MKIKFNEIVFYILFASSVMKNLFPGLSKFVVKLICSMAVGLAFNACCLLKSIAVIL